MKEMCRNALGEQEQKMAGEHRVLEGGQSERTHLLELPRAPSGILLSAFYWGWQFNYHS